jgi:hypothetical protein
MANGHGGRRTGAGRKRKILAENNQVVAEDRTRLKAAALEQQQHRAIARGKLETASRIEARRLELLAEEIR